MNYYYYSIYYYSCDLVVRHLEQKVDEFIVQ